MHVIFINHNPHQQHLHCHLNSWLKPVSHSQVQDICGFPTEDKMVAVAGTLDGRHWAPGLDIIIIVITVVLQSKVIIIVIIISGGQDGRGCQDFGHLGGD